LSSLRRLPDPRGAFGGIGWRLTASYALVVLAVAAALSIAATYAALSKGENQVNQTSVTGILQKDAGAAGRYLRAIPSAGVLRYWVVIPTLEDLAGRGRLAVAVLDSSGRLVVADSCTRAAYQSGSPAICRSAALSLLRPLLRDPGTRRLLDSAAHGTATAGAAGGRAFTAIPILAGGKQRSAGALVAAFAGSVPGTPSQSALTRFSRQWKASLPQNWLWLVALTILLGTTIGALLSHRHVRRVTRIAAVARGWSRGDLSATADASRHDELGHLAADLNQMAEQIRNLLDTRSALAIQQERRRVQRDLHDGIKQELFATSMQLAAAKASLPPEADALATALDQAHASNRRAQHELAALLDQAAPPPTHSDLESALAEIGHRLTNETSLQLIQDVHHDQPLSSAAQEAIYRVAQEALTNVHRHANASTVTLSLASDGTEARLQIRDDGRGFQPQQPSPGMGLQTMRERVEALGGRLTIESNTAGTTIEAILPAAPE
jgi:signal transduction histidine kinase